MDLTSLIIGLLIGGVLASIIFYLLNKSKNVSKSEYDALMARYNETITILRISENSFQTLQATNESRSNKIASKENEVVQL